MKPIRELGSAAPSSSDQGFEVRVTASAPYPILSLRKAEPQHASRRRR
jgi:hypothetical protein